MKRMPVFMFVVVLCLCFFSGMGKVALAYTEVENHPIDVKLQRMLEEDSSTSGTWSAYEYAYKEWDKLLNENYQALMKRLSREEQDKLRASQRAWIKYHDLEFDFNGTYWSGFAGTMYTTLPGVYKYMIVRERALRLGYYLEDLRDRE